MRMLELDYKTMFGTHVCNMQFTGLLIRQKDFLPFSREFVFPVAVPLRFRLPPAVAHLRITMRPMVYFLRSAFGNNRRTATWTYRTVKVGCSFYEFIIDSGKTHILNI